MRGKRLRFKDSEIESYHPASCRFDATSAPYEAIGDLPRPSEASTEPKTSEFAFFKRLKQNIGQTSSRNPINRESNSMRSFGLSNRATELDKPKHKDAKFSQHVKKPTSNEIYSFLTHRNAALESSAMARKEHDNERFNCASLIKTPTSNILDSFISTTANSPENPKSQQKDGDIFSSKRQKLLQWIAKTLFPEADEIPTECNLFCLLLNRLLPESSRDILSQNPRVRQSDTKEICQLNFDSNIQLMEDSDTSRMLVKVSKDHFVDSSISASQSRRFWGTFPCGETVEGLDASAARNSYRMLLEHKEGNELHSSLNGYASGSWSNKEGDTNLLTWGNDLCDYSTSASSRVLNKEAYMQFSYDDAFDRSQSCRLSDRNHSYVAVNRSYNSFAATKSSDLVYNDETYDFTLDRGEQLSPNSWYDSCSHISFERSRPSALSILRDSYNTDYINDFETRREPQPLLLGWDTNVFDMHVSTHISHMDLKTYLPPSFREDRPGSPELEMYCSPCTWRKDYWGGLEKSNWLHMSPSTYQDHVYQGHNLRKNNSVPRSQIIPYLSCGVEKVKPDYSGISLNTSRGSRFFIIPQTGCHFPENMMYERNCPALESHLISQDIESDSGWKYKSLTGILDQQCDRSSDNVLKLLGPGNSGSQFPIADESNLERWCFPSVHSPVGQKDLFPLQLRTIGWKDTEVETYD